MGTRLSGQAAKRRRSRPLSRDGSRAPGDAPCRRGGRLPARAGAPRPRVARRDPRRARSCFARAEASPDAAARARGLEGPRMKLALFDLDNTLLAGDSDYEWGQFLVDQ